MIFSGLSRFKFSTSNSDAPSRLVKGLVRSCAIILKNLFFVAFSSLSCSFAFSISRVRSITMSWRWSWYCCITVTSETIRQISPSTPAGKGLSEILRYEAFSDKLLKWEIIPVILSLSPFSRNFLNLSLSTSETRLIKFKPMTVRVESEKISVKRWLQYRIAPSDLIIAARRSSKASKPAIRAMISC